VTRPFFIDTDTGSDDAVALVIAFTHPGIDVVGLGIVAGNVPLELGVQNALYTRELCGRDDVPIHAGEAAPLRVPLTTAQNVHGTDGMGDIGLPLHGRAPAEGHAVDALLRASHAHAGELTLVTLGPLTNVARALERDPSLPDRVPRTVVMGAAADHVGNVTPVAEYNMWADPHAVDVVLGSGLQLEFVGWDISRHHTVIDTGLAAELRAIGTPLAEFCVDINAVVALFCATETKLSGFDLPDPVTVAYAIDPLVATSARRLHLCAPQSPESPRRALRYPRPRGAHHRLRARVGAARPRRAVLRRRVHGQPRRARGVDRCQRHREEHDPAHPRRRARARRGIVLDRWHGAADDPGRRHVAPRHDASRDADRGRPATAAGRGAGVARRRGGDARRP
jgi:purine nucleosidase